MHDHQANTLRLTNMEAENGPLDNYILPQTGGCPLPWNVSPRVSVAMHDHHSCRPLNVHIKGFGVEGWHERAGKESNCWVSATSVSDPDPKRCLPMPMPDCDSRLGGRCDETSPIAQLRLAPDTINHVLLVQMCQSLATASRTASSARRRGARGRRGRRRRGDTW